VKEIQVTDTATTSKIDPVCGMTVDLAEAEASGLTKEHGGETYAFCSRGCLLDFTDDPATYLDSSYTPSM
jgi:YHS domain-containing protein